MKDSRIDLTKFSVVETEVAIIGNGPAGLTASFILSGNNPVYNGIGHPDPMLSARLSSCPGSQTSILTTERLKYLSQGMEEFGGSSQVGTLFDSLMHPGSQMGLKRESPISWVPSNQVDHVVLGEGAPGGIWQRLDPDLLTLSLNSWMELPGLRISHDSQRRTTAREVARYYLRYVQQKGLSKHQQNCKVISVKFIGNDNEKWRWETIALDPNGNYIMYHSRFCILATGSSVPNRLNVEGEEDHCIVHDLVALESNITQPCRVLIIGAGLSAADAVLLARFRNCEITHSYRTDDVTLGQMLPESLYPEYHKVREMMRSSCGYPGYTALPGTTVKSLKGKVAILTTAGFNKETSIDFDIAAVLIGSSADLSYMTDYRGGLDLTEKEALTKINPKLNPISVNPWTYEASKAKSKGLYAIGSLAGDIYVRYIPGGAVAACAHIIGLSQLMLTS